MTAQDRSYVAWARSVGRMPNPVLVMPAEPTPETIPGTHEWWATNWEKLIRILRDYGVEVNFNSFAEVIDQVGGVDITLTANEVAHLRGKGYNVQEGLNHMDGETALAHARNRTTGGSGDLARSSRQRAVIEALIAKAVNMNVGSLSFSETGQSSLVGRE